MIALIGIAQNSKEVLLFFLQKEKDNTYLKIAKSLDGFSFDAQSKYIFAFDLTHKEEQHYEWSSLRMAREQDGYILTYKNRAKNEPGVLAAISSDMKSWQEIGTLGDISQTSTFIPLYQHNESYVVYTGDENIYVAYSKNLMSWKHGDTPILTRRPDFFDNAHLEAGNAYKIESKILLTYYGKKQVNGKTHYAVGAAYFDMQDPEKLLWQSEEPIYELPEEFYTDDATPLGSAIIHDELVLYWSVGKNSLFSVSCPLPKISDVAKKDVFTHIVKKAHNNPIMSPRPHVPWDSRASFNSAAILEDGKVHFLYRALGDTDLSVLGYATSSDGTTIDTRSNEPAYIPREPFETPGGNRFSSIAQHFVSGGGYGGVEDPRITRVEDKIYLTYVAFDGATPPRAAISHISVDDFLKNDWNKWDNPKLISAPGMVNKSAVILPRKVKGKYVVMHRVYPNILVDYLDDLKFENYLQGHHFIPPRKKFWDSKKVGAGAPPIETKDGWLLIYQSVGYQDPSRYKIGAMILDINNPEKVLYRTHVPIIEPNMHYENNGFKAGVVYPCGAVIMNNKINIYYGGSDSFLCAATADADNFLYEMKRNREPKVRAINFNFN